MINLKPLILVGENEKGELVALRITEGDSIVSTDNIDAPIGTIVENPSPAQVKLEEDLKRPGQNLQVVLDKYKEKK